MKLDGPVDPARMLYAELVEGAFEGVKGIVRPDWDLQGRMIPKSGNRFSEKIMRKGKDK